MYRVVQIRIGEGGKIYHFNARDLELSVGDLCIVEGDRGLEYGEVVSLPESVLDAEIEGEMKDVIRKVTPADLKAIENNKKEARKAYKTCLQRIETHKLPMKLVFVEYSFDKHKLIFYFTADGRVDFRELVKDLAGIFRVRIELRQIGVRDEAKLLGGIGPCGRPLCCATFLKDFEPVNIKMAKLQKLPVNPEKISGLCGRLMCCLKFENELYKKYAAQMPSEGSKVTTKYGEGYVKDLNYIKQLVTVDLGDGREVTVPVNELLKRE